MLEQQLDAGGPAPRQAVAEGAGQHDVAAHVLAIEEAGVAFEDAVLGDGFEVEGGEFGFEGGARRGACVQHEGIAWVGTEW